MGKRSELFWLRAIASLADVIAPLSISEAEQARQLVNHKNDMDAIVNFTYYHVD